MSKCSITTKTLRNWKIFQISHYLVKYSMCFSMMFIIQYLTQFSQNSKKMKHGTLHHQIQAHVFYTGIYNCNTKTYIPLVLIQLYYFC